MIEKGVERKYKIGARLLLIYYLVCLTTRSAQNMQADPTERDVNLVSG